MRRGALALLLLATGCGQSGGGGNRLDAADNRSEPAIADEQSEAAATLTLAASGPGNCSARWDNQPATAGQVLERSSALIERAIGQAGSVSNLTDETLPTIAVNAPASLSFACADSFLSAVRRSGVPSVLLSPEGQRDAALADFTLSDIAAPPPSVVLALGAGGRLTWNGEAILVGEIADRLRQLGGGGASEIEAPAGELELRPARDATFGQVHEVVLAVRAGHIRVALLLPSVPPAPRPSAPAPPPSAGNQAAPRP